MAFDLDLGPMNIRARMARSLGLVVLLVGALLPVRAQVSENKPPSVTQILDDIKQHPGNSKLYVALGLAYWDRNDYPRALEAFQLAVKFGPTSAEAHNWVGVATLEQGDFPGAATEFRKAISLDPKYARAYTNLGSALAKNGQVAEAVDIFRKALALEPKNSAARMNLAVALRENGNAKEALVHLRSSLTTSQTMPTFNTRSAKLCSKAEICAQQPRPSKTPCASTPSHAKAITR